MGDQANVPTQRSSCLVQVLTANNDRARRRAHQRGHDTDQRGLACTIGTKEGQKLTLSHTQIGAPKRHSKAAMRKKRALRDRIEAMMKTVGSRPVAPLAMVITL